jgi:GxxExxY protein
MEVHRVLGSGFLEAVYQEAFARELSRRNIPFRMEVELPVFYKGENLSMMYRADFVCYESVIVELKAIKQLTIVEEAQILNYLKATGFVVGILFNCGATSLQHRRFVCSPKKSAQSGVSLGLACESALRSLRMRGVRCWI